MNAATPCEGTPPGKSNEIVVFMVRRETKCDECGCELFDGELLRLEDNHPLCMKCADLGHLEFLGSGNTALTRRATKHSPLRAVVVRWARARKRYERQGILVTGEAIDQAETECLADEDRRARQRERAAERRKGEDLAYEAATTEKLKELSPVAPRTKPHASQRGPAASIPDQWESPAGPARILISATTDHVRRAASLWGARSP